MESIKKNFTGYRMYIYTFAALTTLTLLAVWIKHVRFAMAFTVGLIMFIAVIQAAIVLFYNMHLKFQEKILTVFVGGTFALMIALIVITMFDYIFPKI